MPGNNRYEAIILLLQLRRDQQSLAPSPRQITAGERTSPPSTRGEEGRRKAAFLFAEAEEASLSSLE